MGKKKKKAQLPSDMHKVYGLVIGTLLAVVGWLIVALYEELKEDIHGTTAALERNTMEIFQLRTDFIRLHPDVGRAAYAASIMSRNDELTLNEARAVYVALTSDKITELTEVHPNQLRDVLSDTHVLSERQINAVASAYFDFDPQDADSVDIDLVYEGLAAIRPTLFVFDERMMPSTAEYSRLSFLFAAIFVALLVTTVFMVIRAFKSSNGYTEDVFEVRQVESEKTKIEDQK